MSKPHTVKRVYPTLLEKIQRKLSGYPKRLTVLVAMLVGGVSVALHVNDQAPRLNKYEHAQKATVLLQTEHGYGSGFVVRRGEKLFVWTAAHVTEKVNTLQVHQVIRHGNHKVGLSTFRATVIARDETLDLALLSLDAPPSYFTSVHFSRLPALPVGTAVYHVGNFSGPQFDGSVSTGIVSQIGVTIAGTLWSVLDQMTTPAFPGSSGGPVFTGDGEVVGVLVGGVSPVLDFFVPVRAMWLFAETQNVRFALDWEHTPTEAQLKVLTARAEYREPVLTEEPKTSTICQ